MSNEVRSEEKQPTSERVKSPKPTKETWLKARVDYESGNYEGMRQLADKYSIDYKKLREKAYEDDWIEFKTTTSGKIRQVIEEETANEVQEFFGGLKKKSNYYEKLVQASQAQASRNSEGIPELEPTDLEKYSRVEDRAIDWKKTALGINDKVQVNADVTVNVLGILNQVRTMQDKPEVKERVIDVEYLKECSKNLV